MASQVIVVLTGQIARRRDAAMVAAMRARIPFSVRYFPGQLLWFRTADRYGPILNFVIWQVITK
jgi:hypothetical protein